MFEGLAILGDSTLILIGIAGTIVASVIAVTPGLGGIFAVVIVLPLAYQLEPTQAIVLLVSVAVVSGTANTVTSVLLGVPGSPSAVATIVDGHPMAKRGEGVRAIASGLTASAIGGAFGALCLGLMIPLLRPIVLMFGPAEFLVIVVVALLGMASLGEIDGIRMLISVSLGLMFSFVGLEGSTGAQRFTFGELYLWDGLHIAAVAIGIFALTEMCRLVNTGLPIADRLHASPSMSQIRRGVLDVFRHWKIGLRSSVIGVIVGMAPGVGGTGGQFIAYSQTVKFSPERDEEGRKFGEGRVEGVIGADASTNSVEGGSLVPTLALGIPGSPQMAILLGVFVTIGIRPGPSMLVDHNDLVWMIIWILVAANVFAAAFTLMFTPLLSKIAFVRPEFLVPPVFVLSLVGAYASNNHFGDVLVALFFTGVGLWMVRTGLSRIGFIIGFVLGPLTERYLLLTWSLYGWEFLARPVVQVMLAALFLLFLGPPLVRRAFATHQRGSM